VAIALEDSLKPGLQQLGAALDKKVELFKDIMKIGRTHLMDATPLSLGQEFSGYAAQVRKGLRRCDHAISALQELAIGGTAVGTGINCHPEFSGRVCQLLNKRSGQSFREADNHFEAQGGRDDCVEVAGQLATIAASLGKVANDIRLLGSGPRCGIGELFLPATQPGSSIMPGKVNPVMSEMLVQAAIFTQGMTGIVSACGRDGHFELNVTMPLMARSLLEAVVVLGNAAGTFAEKCVNGLEVDRERCEALVQRSLMLVTALNPHIGYDNAAKVAKKAFAENKTLRQVVLELKLMDSVELDKALDPSAMI
jgi:fumarate hydratase class II